MLSISSKYLKFILIFAIIAFGIFIRTHVFLQKASFFCDESAIILNLYEKNYLGLFFPLKYDQQAAPLFLIISKFMLMKFGINEIMLRLVPYLSSIFSLLLFYLLSKKIFKNNLSTIFATFLFACNLPLIEVSQVLKQYSSDAFFSVIAMFVVVNLDFEKINTKKVVLLSFLTILSFWCAYPMVIIIFSFILLFLIKSLMSKNYQQIKHVIIFTILNLFGACVYYFTNLHGPSSSKELHLFWEKYPGFFPNTYDQLIGLNHYIFNINNSTELLLVFMLICLGSFSLIKKDKFTFGIIVFPILCTLILSALEIYPFVGRLIIFLIPNFIILVSSSLDFIEIKKNSLISIFVISMAVLFIASTDYIPYFIDFVKSKTTYEKAYAREYISLLKKENIDKNSAIFIHPIMGMSFEVYSRGDKISQSQVIISPNNLETLPRKKIIYFYLTHNKTNPLDENALILREKWIKNNCIILKENKIEDRRFIKCYIK